MRRLLISPTIKAEASLYTRARRKRTQLTRVCSAKELITPPDGAEDSFTGGSGDDQVVVTGLNEICSDPIILIDLKWSQSVKTVLNQIYERRCPDFLKDHNDKILFVGINYDKATKKHTCRIEAF